MARRKRGTDGRYQKVFRFEGKMYCCKGSTQAEADDKASAKLEELKKGIEQRKNPTLRQYYEEFTENRRGKVGENTLRNQAIEFRNIAAVPVDSTGKEFGDLHLIEIKPDVLKHVQRALHDDGRTVRTVNDYLAHLSHVLRTAVKDELIDRNPCQSLDRLVEKSPAAPVSETKHRALSTDETNRFFATAKAEGDIYYNAYALMLQTGMRIGEVGALKLENVKGKEIQIRATITRTESGGYKVGDVPKTDAGRRNIPMNEAVDTIIEDQKKLMRDLNGNIIPIDGLLFKSSAKELLREYTVNRAIKRICKKAGIEEFTCHAFRSTYATKYMQQRPNDFLTLSKLLGHKNPNITFKWYCRVTEQAKREAVNAVVIPM